MGKAGSPELAEPGGGRRGEERERWGGGRRGKRQEAGERVQGWAGQGEEQKGDRRRSWASPEV